MDHKYANYITIFGIYIHELACIPIFKAFAHFLAELLTLTNLCHLCDLKVAETHRCMHIAYHQKFLLTTLINENMVFQ